MKTKIETPKAPLPGSLPYSQAVVAGNFVFVSGHIPTTVDGKLVSGTIEDQTHQVMKNLQAVLEGAGATFADVVKTTIFITDMADYAKVNEIYASYMTPPYPARETVSVKDLPRAAWVEISMTAVKS